MSAAWMHMLDQICPEYEDLTTAIERGPAFVAKIISKEDFWIFSIEEIWHTGDCSLLPTPIMLDNIISWAEKQLEKQNHCRRISWNSWEFTSKKSAKHFQIIFYLSWDQSSIR